MDLPEFGDVREAETFGRAMDKETYWLIFRRRFHWINQADAVTDHNQKVSLYAKAMRDLACCHAFGDEELSQNSTRKHDAQNL